MALKVTTYQCRHYLNITSRSKKVERSFRLLKIPEFLTSSIFLKKPQRIEALLMIMTLSLLVYAALEHKVREQLSQSDEFFLRER